MRSKRSKFPGPWRKISKFHLAPLIEKYKQLILKKTGDVWDPRQLYYVAKACALYELKTGQKPIINEMKYGVYLEGVEGRIFILYRPIRYTGPFTRGYRYVKVNVPAGTYKIIKIKKKKCKTEKNSKRRNRDLR